MDTLIGILVLIALVGILRSIFRSPGLWYAAAILLTLAGLFGPAVVCVVVGFLTHLTTPPRRTD